jgi:general secretion pathway protein K
VGSLPRAQGGVALLLVLWSLALLTIMAVAMTSAQRTESSLAANQLGGARFRALADAAIHYTALNLSASPSLAAGAAEDGPGEPWVPDGETRIWRFAGETLTITLVNEASLIDLNQAPRELLSGLLTAVGVAEEDQGPLLDAILDWRDADGLQLLNGAEDPDYEAAGRPYGAMDGPFRGVEELLQVLGFDRQLYDLLSPALTVHSGRAGVAEDLAPKLVRAALAGVTLAELEQRLLEEQAAEIVGDEPPFLNRGGPVYRVRVSAELAPGGRRSMESLIRLEQNAASPVVVLWQRFALRRPEHPPSEAAVTAE